LNTWHTTLETVYMIYLCRKRTLGSKSDSNCARRDYETDQTLDVREYINDATNVVICHLAVMLD
jgi:hypothetical protein